MNQLLPPDDAADASGRKEGIDDAQLDRLVDGELSDDERRVMIESLDRTADGWRRLALAFLEAQAWRDEIAFAAPPGSISPAAPARTRPEPPRKPKRSPAATSPGWIAVSLVAAASFLLALGIGWGWRVWWSAPLGAPAATTAPPSVSSPADNVAQPRPANLRPPVRTLAERPSQRALTPAASRPAPVGDVKLLMADGREIEVPVYDLMQGGAQWLSAEPVVPSNLVQALQQAGLQVKTRQEWIPVQIEGSDPMVVPVEQLDIFPVARAGPYQ